MSMLHMYSLVGRPIVFPSHDAETVQTSLCLRAEGMFFGFCDSNQTYRGLTQRAPWECLTSEANLPCGLPALQWVPTGGPQPGQPALS